MPDEDKEQRTEEATDKRRRETREKGRFVQSKEVTSATIMSAIVFSLYYFGIYMVDRLTYYTRDIFTQVSFSELNIDLTVNLIYGMMKIALLTIGPIVIVIIIAVVTVQIIQGGGIVLTVDPLTPKFSKINPLEGVKRLFSLNSFVELIKSMLKIILVGFIAFKTVKAEFSSLPSLMEQESSQILQHISWVSIKIIFYTLLAIMFLAIIDYAYQSYSFEESIKMTKQEIKDERKETEGDPRLKARIRSIQLETARRRMMDAVPTSDVVITNPTHLAVALKYDRAKMIAPEVMAKGAGFLAERIKRIAEESGVPIVEDKPVARLIYQVSDIGHGIPVEIYKAVAEILAYVYRLRR